MMFESLACGKPFVGTDVGGILEIINNNKLGYVVEPENSDKLATAMLKAIKINWDHDYIVGYSSQFTWKDLAGRTMNIYNEAFSENSTL